MERSLRKSTLCAVAVLNAVVKNNPYESSTKEAAKAISLPRDGIFENKEFQTVAIYNMHI